jgi:transketolase
MMTKGIHSESSIPVKEKTVSSRSRLQMTASPGPGDGREGTRAQGTIDEQCVDTIRTLAMEAVQRANSGHPGTPMALAPVVYTLWQRFLRFDPDEPIWPNRDRFVLSNGHTLMLLYALLHLTGVKAVNAEYGRLVEPAVALDDIKLRAHQASNCSGIGAPPPGSTSSMST